MENSNQVCSEKSLGGVEWYREKIVEMVGNIEDEKILKRIYELAEYLYIYK